MATLAYHLREAFRPSTGLDRSSCVELYHVTQITGWTRQNTGETVFAYVGVNKGDPHPDPALSGAVCTNITLAEGPFVNPTSGAVEAIVAVSYDSNRRWGAASYFESGQYGRSDLNHRVPNFSILVEGGATSLDPVYTRDDFVHPRGIHTRIENRNGNGITEVTKQKILGYTGRVFMVGEIPYLYDAPQIIKLRTNSVLVRYTFVTKSPIMGFDVTSDGRIAVEIPALDWMEEYRINVNVPEITVKGADEYGDILDPTILPFWTSPI